MSVKGPLVTHRPLLSPARGHVLLAYINEKASVPTHRDFSRGPRLLLGAYTRHTSYFTWLSTVCMRVHPLLLLFLIALGDISRCAVSYSFVS